MAITFYIGGGFTVFFVLLMLLQKNPVVSALYLVLSFFSLASVYLSLDAYFIAALQILVYAGAIMVLFIFVLMLLNLKPSELKFDAFTFKNLFLFVFPVVLMGLLFALIQKIPQIPQIEFTSVPAGFGEAKAVGALFLDQYVVAFEVMGVLLTIGLLGAVLLGRKD